MAAKLSYSRAFGSGPVAKRESSRKVVFILAATFLLCSLTCEPILAANSEPPRYRVFSLRHISAEQGKKYLAKAKIGTVSQLPGPNVLLVTAQRSELIKASAILKLVDANEPFVIKVLFPASAVKKLPSNEQIAAEVGNISIGTFSEPPAPVASFLRSKTAGAAKSMAIIDIHNDAVIAVAPARELKKIITAIEQLQEGEAAASFLRSKTVGAKLDKPVDPNQISELKPGPALRASLLSMAGSEAELDKIAAPVSSGVGGQAEAGDSESDELFDKLLGSLAEAEKKMAESRRVETEPNEPKEPSVGPEQPKEPDLLAAVLERLNALEVAVKRGPEPQRPEEQVAVKIEKPGEVVGPEPISNGDEMLELDLPPKINIIQLLDLVSEFLGYDYMYDPADVAGLKGEVTITMRKIKVKHLYPLLESVLKFKGFVMTRREGSNLLIVVPRTKAIEIDPPLRSEQAKDVIGDVVITRLFELKDIDTASAQTLLAGMKLGVSITSIPEAKQLIVTEYAYRMARIKELLEMIDKPGEPRQFRSRQLKYTMATALAPKIKTLAEQLGTVSIAIGTPTAAARPSAPAPRGESSAARRARLAREAAARTAAARAAAARGAAVGPAAAKPTVYLDADERTNRILMIGLAEQLAIVDELIDTLDVEKQDLRTLRLYEIQHVDAEEVVRKLGELGIISGGQVSARGPTRTITRTPTTKVSRPTTPVTTRTGTIGEPLVEEPQVVIIESTNSLLVNATAEQHTQIAVIIGYVDSEVEQGVIPYVVYPLENQDPEELATTLNKLVMETTTRQDKDAKIVTTTKKLEEDIYIISDPKTYSLIVYASKKNQQWISSLIKQLDEYRPQVLLDVTLVEITKNDKFNYDLNLISSFPDLANTSGLTGTIIEGITSSDIISALDSSGRDRFIDLQADSGAGTAFYGDKHINLLLTAVQEKDYGRILAKPKLLVNDNENGVIETTETTYRTRTETTIQTTSGEPITSRNVIFDPFDSGIKLDIQPHISKGDQLRLIITLTRSDFRDTTASLRTVDPTPPDKLTSDVTTVITVPDGTTIILGGLEKLDQSKGGTKVPLLGDIPVIGGLFRSIANTDSQSRLYIFVKAHILRPGEEAAAVSDIEVVSAKNRATFEKYEKEMQEYEDWPGIKPKPMDPLRILEADEESSR